MHHALMNIRQCGTRLDSANGALLGVEYNLIQRPLRSAEPPCDRKRTGDIASVQFKFGARIDQYQTVFTQRCAVFNIVQDTGVGTAADNRAVSRATGALPDKLML